MGFTFGVKLSFKRRCATSPFFSYTQLSNAVAGASWSNSGNGTLKSWLSRNCTCLREGRNGGYILAPELLLGLAMAAEPSSITIRMAFTMEWKDPGLLGHLEITSAIPHDELP
jgi:hypothetical protein